METIEVRVEGFDFDEVASYLAQLSKDEAVNIQVKHPSYGPGGLALDSSTIILIASGINLLAAVINLLSKLPSGTGVEGGKASRKYITLQTKGRKYRLPLVTPPHEIKIEDYIGQNGEKRMTVHLVNLEAGI